MDLNTVAAIAAPDFWVNLQLRWDLYHAQQADVNDLKAIQPHYLLAQPVG